MIETPEQYEKAEEAVAKLKGFLLAARRTHTADAYRTLSAPILRELQERERDILVYLSRSPEMLAGS
ncbi:hypothetical protein [Candidatus Entotheonella palauensis]|uniref:Uncharacterized protein n=1 Tax=Candidatus Entotheonella gemina TaxID=1429439 RepID=W4M6C9_9BACT|nr:hypothetical protein [Candidatus Entotheonella palauensis]ETX05197.1 MAG: hypothetical protein ETSY2_24415 [Candidatus Entotheonella gemina]